MTDIKIQLTKELFETIKQTLKGVPSARPIAYPAGQMRAILREIDVESLPNGDTLEDS